MTTLTSLTYLTQCATRWRMKEKKRRYKDEGIFFRVMQGYDYTTPDWMEKPGTWSVFMNNVLPGSMSGHEQFEAKEAEEETQTAFKCLTSHWQSNPLLWPLNVYLAMYTHKATYKCNLQIGNLTLRNCSNAGISVENTAKALDSLLDISNRIWKTGSGPVSAWAFVGEAGNVLARSPEEALLMRTAILKPHQFYPFKEDTYYPQPYECVSPNVDERTRARHALLETA